MGREKGEESAVQNGTATGPSDPRRRDPCTADKASSARAGRRQAKPTLRAGLPTLSPCHTRTREIHPSSLGPAHPSRSSGESPTPVEHRSRRPDFPLGAAVAYQRGRNVGCGGGHPRPALGAVPSCLKEHGQQLNAPRPVGDATSGSQRRRGENC